MPTIRAVFGGSFNSFLHWKGEKISFLGFPRGGMLFGYSIYNLYIYMADAQEVSQKKKRKDNNLADKQVSLSNKSAPGPTKVLFHVTSSEIRRSCVICAWENGSCFWLVGWGDSQLPVITEL